MEALETATVGLRRQTILLERAEVPVQSLPPPRQFHGDSVTARLDHDLSSSTRPNLAELEQRLLTAVVDLQRQ